MSHERSQQRLKRKHIGGSPTLVTLALVSLTLLGYEILRQNDADLAKHWPDLLDRSSTMAMLTAVAAVWAAREQFAQGLRPKFQFWSRRVSRSRRLPGAGPFWKIVIVNRGSGPLDVASVRFHIRELPHGPTQFAPDVARLRETLGRHGFIEGTHYWLVNFSPGAGLGPTAERDYFECTPEMERLTMLDAVFEFDAALGDRYEKTIPLLPGPHASEVVVNEDDDVP